MGKYIMGYLLVGLTLVCGALKGYCGKKTSYLTEDIADAAGANLIRMCLCIAIGGASVMIGANVGGLIISPSALAVCALCGFFTAAFVITWLLAVKSSAYMMVDCSAA